MTADIIRHLDCREWRSWSQLLKDPAGWAILDLTRVTGLQHYIGTCMNSTAGNRYRYSLKHGYTSRALTWAERNERLDQLHAVNTSSDIRQGRPMAEHYRNYPAVITGNRTCDKHYSEFIGVFNASDTLVGYITANFFGEMAASSQILGHAEHLKAGIMLNLWTHFVQICLERGIKGIIYSRWSDGHDSLRYWKHSVGLRPMKIQISDI